MTPCPECRCLTCRALYTPKPGPVASTDPTDPGKAAEHLAGLRRIAAEAKSNREGKA